MWPCRANTYTCSTIQEAPFQRASSACHASCTHTPMLARSKIVAQDLRSTPYSAAGPGIGHDSTVWAVAFEPGGARAASVSDDRTLRLWRCGRDGAEPRWRPLACLAGVHERAVFSVDWGATGLVTGACTLPEPLEALTHKIEKCELRRHTPAVLSDCPLKCRMLGGLACQWPGHGCVHTPRAPENPKYVIRQQFSPSDARVPGGMPT